MIVTRLKAKNKFLLLRLEALVEIDSDNKLPDIYYSKVGIISDMNLKRLDEDDVFDNFLAKIWSQARNSTISYYSFTTKFRGYAASDPMKIPQLNENNKNAPESIVELMQRGVEFGCDQPKLIHERPTFTLVHQGQRETQIDPEEFHDDSKGFIVGHLTSQSNDYPDGFCVQVDFRLDHDVTLVTFSNVQPGEESFMVQFWNIENNRWEYVYKAEDPDSLMVFKYKDGARFLLPVPVRVLRLFPVKWESYAAVPFPKFFECNE
ncbi:hypothetical protein CAPTEDRAFT_198412 [Capitella teleta]|uniref:Uncharacterized protein n=1 Tax=Capitella teleta TaxID=283909 RepID=R7TDH8_CAPTE|nr:hypothetical protein CAPTEDRAFT_198412 [Capitella teleta]|eukprot:ELT91562.1 hypothetical protein CAPTEDRAFT_198412 [Capitella teleta]